MSFNLLVIPDRPVAGWVVELMQQQDLPHVLFHDPRQALGAIRSARPGCVVALVSVADDPVLDVIAWISKVDGYSGQIYVISPDPKLLPIAQTMGCTGFFLTTDRSNLKEALSRFCNFT